MPTNSDADTIRILVATDNHVGYNERDKSRSTDSWKTFHEIMGLAKERDVDMVLLAGDLFHHNNPSRKAMAEVMMALRANCLGDKPCELEMLSDASENFSGLFNFANYEDPDINVAIPVFSIHGNHDDPSGGESLAALDLLQIAGLVNYYGRAPESDNVNVKPVLLQKGRTKLALYGLSNIRDERLFRTFSDGKVKFYRPGQQQKEWFNLMSVHQNHHAYTEKGYLPENFLPDFMDLIIWGHEHECLIDPRYNQEMGFHVMQPGSSVATSLMPGEAVAKHVAILSIKGQEFETENIRLRSVRPFVMREIVLSEEKALKNVSRKDGNRQEVTKHLKSIVFDMINEANKEWRDTHDDDELDSDGNPPRPLIRLRVEYSAPDGGHFDCENPQRFSNNFIDKVANANDVVQFYRKKANATRKSKDAPDMPEESVMAQLALDTVKVEKLVREFLMAQSLTILPQNSFGDAVSQFVDKDDKHAMEMFVNDSLANQVKQLLSTEEQEDEDIVDAMQTYRAKLEDMFASGQLKNVRKGKLKPKPENWDTDIDGEWEEQPGAYVLDEESDSESDNDPPPTKPAARGRGKATTTTRTNPASKAAAVSSKAPATRTTKGRGSRKIVEDEDDDDDDVIMLDDDDDNDEEESQSQGLFVKPSRSAPKKNTRQAPSRSISPVKKAPTRTKPTARSTAPSTNLRQGKLNFGPQSQTQTSAVGRRGKTKEPSDDEISDDDDDDDAFEPAPPPTRSTRSRR